MPLLVCLYFLLGAYPLWYALRANRRTTLWQTLLWVLAAWASWGILIPVALLSSAGADLSTGRYIALCLTSCAGVAVLGARRPGVAAWNFVLLGLLAVLLLPLAEGLVLGDRPLGWLRLLFVAGMLLVTVVNYLPTWLAPAAVLLAAACGFEVFLLIQPEAVRLDISPGWLVLGVTPLVAFCNWWRQPVAVTEFDRIWRDFRNRYGLVWAQRVREQFNRAAHHAGRPISLGWRGLPVTSGTASPDERMQKELIDILKAILKRFGTQE